MRQSKDFAFIIAAALFSASGCAGRQHLPGSAPPQAKNSVDFRAIAVMPLEIEPRPLADGGMEYTYNPLNDNGGNRTLRCPSSRSLRATAYRVAPVFRSITATYWPDTTQYRNLTIDPGVPGKTVAGSIVVYNLDCSSLRDMLARAQ